MDTFSYLDQLATFFGRWWYACVLGALVVIGIATGIRFQKAKRRPGR
jgi:hypothetical protein